MFRATEYLYPNVIRRRAQQGNLFATIVDPSGQTDLQYLTYADIENASNRAAWFLDQNLKNEIKVYYMGPNDIRYPIWVIGGMKAGKCVALPAPGNSVSANTGLFEKVGASTLLYAPEAKDTLSPLLDATRTTVKLIATMTYQELLGEDIVDVYPFTATFEEVKDTQFLCLHTSGTSGHPKPIYWNHSAAATIPSFMDPDIAGEEPNRTRDLFDKATLLLLFPLFHFAGIASILSAVQAESTIAIPSSGTRLTPANVSAMLQRVKCTTLFIPPPVLESCHDHPPALEALGELETVVYSGGSINPGRGEELTKHIKHLGTILGSTEGGPLLAASTRDNKHWNAFRFLDVGQRMEEVATGVYELVFSRNDLQVRANGYFHTFPHLESEFRTADLYAPVENEPGWWIYRGRTDNWMMLSNGLKMDPTDMESIIGAHPDVKGALIAGSYRPQPCLLVELKHPPTDQESREKALDALWPAVEKANQGMRKIGRIPRELILFATEKKPFLRASKGTIQRVLTITDYAPEIDQAYAEAEESLLTGGLPPLQSPGSASDLISLLEAIFSQTMQNSSDDVVIDIDEDLFTRGLDSLGISVVLARLKATLRKHGVSDEKLKLIKNQLIYKEPTVTRLANALSTILSGAAVSDETAESQALLNQVLDEYEQKLHGILAAKEASNGLKTNGYKGTKTGHTVILTGSTGSVGSYILSSLLARNDVNKIICLNRSPDAAQKQAASFRSRGITGLDKAEASQRVVYMQAALHDPHLGLSDIDYQTLQTSATTIIHNAFPVNFLLGLRAFEPQLQGLLNLIELADSSAKHAAVLFISSISAGLPVMGDSSVVPETVLPRERAGAILSQGYAQAKYICESLLQTYASASNEAHGQERKASILRVGQVSGPLVGPGVWNPAEWAPSLVLSSKYLGACPESIGELEVNWVPVDKLGEIVCEIMSSSPSSSASATKPSSSSTDENGIGTDTASENAFTLYNIVNPHATSWADLLPALKPIAKETVPASEWIGRLEGSEQSGAQHLLTQNPGLKLLDFYKQTMLTSSPDGKAEDKVITTEIDNLLRASETARTLCQIEQRDLQHWMRGWGL
ncbi:hypothetical protein F5Y16DRAFT_388734 [Xylariaceae sp. FL0255]|nr:hypothetical protein F5Y16DRAFT_388734 [Xylariaceae sp. FL0255]